MPRLSFLTTCMGRLEHLRQTLGRVDGQPDSECVVVDYSCPDGSGDWVETHHPRVRVVRVAGRNRFNRSEAANAGAREVRADWICFFDCDILVDPGFASRVLPLLEPGRYTCPHPIRDWALCGTFVCAREDFERVDGYDEVFQGWGERDLDLYGALEMCGIQRAGFPAALLRHIPHGERSRIRFHEVQERHLMQTINRIYRFAKHDLLQAGSGPLDLAARQRLHAEVAARTGAALRTGVRLDLRVTVPGTGEVLGYEVEGRRWASGAMGALYRSPLANRLYRFAKAELLRRTLDLSEAIHGRHLPFGLRLVRVP